MKKIFIALAFASSVAYAQDKPLAKPDTLEAHIIIADRWVQKPEARVQVSHINGYIVVMDKMAQCLDFFKKPLSENIVIMGYVLKQPLPENKANIPTTGAGKN